MDYKYIALDFGGVLVGSPTGSWDFTPKFLELIDINKIDINKYNELRKKYGDILSSKIVTLEEEYDMFYKFYKSILKEFDISDDIIKTIAYNRTYEFDKYFIYNDVINELEYLKSKYRLILITDNWPCVEDYLKKFNLYDYFEKVYVSSIYGVEKKDKLLFDYPVKDFDIKPGEALFIDDNEINLDAAKEKGFDVLLMERNSKNASKYDVINNLML